MSSHHVIRENQEAAVAILDIEGCSFEILGDALEWSPLVIAKAEVTTKLIDRGYKIDLVLSHEQHEFDQQTLQQRHITFLKQQENELQQIIELAYKKQHPGVIIFACFNEIVINKIARPLLPVSIIDGTKKWTLIMSGEFKKWFSKGDTYQLKGGAVKINSGQTAKSINNVEADGMVVLKSKKPFWLGESLI
ncbi:MAG: hypothetical protein ABJH05_17255 [Fulvivirga sp.]